MSSGSAIAVSRGKRQLCRAVRADLVCRRLMTAPGVGAVVALTYRATVDQPQRFVHSGGRRAYRPDAKALPVRRDRLRRRGVQMWRRPATHNALRSRTLTAYHNRKWPWLKAWGVRVAQRRGMRRAIVAVARRLAVVLHRMWVDGSEFRWRKDSTAVPAAI